MIKRRERLDWNVLSDRERMRGNRFSAGRGVLGLWSLKVGRNATKKKRKRSLLFKFKKEVDTLEHRSPTRSS